MKPARFEYHAPRTIEEVVSLKSELGDESMILAGGQSLVPSMNFRLARPSALIDINRVEDGAELGVHNDHISIGPVVRHARFSRPVDDTPTATLLASACRHVGHLPIRTRGTFLGALAHADPAAEWSVVAVATEAKLRLLSTAGERTIAASEFFRGPYLTALNDDEVLVEARVPRSSAESSKTSFLELSRREGDFALVCVAVVGALEGDRMDDVRIALGGVSTKPVRVPIAEQALNGEAVSPVAFEEAAAEATKEIQVIGDIHGSSDYRRALVEIYVRRALERSFLRADEAP